MIVISSTNKKYSHYSKTKTEVDILSIVLLPIIYLTVDMTLRFQNHLKLLMNKRLQTYYL